MIIASARRRHRRGRAPIAPYIEKYLGGGAKLLV